MFRYFGKFLFLATVGMISLASTAYAAPTTFGEVITTTVGSFTNFTGILAMFGYVTGFFFAVLGLFRLKDHVDNPAQNPLSAGVKRFLAGGMFLSLPYMGSVTAGSLMGGAIGTNGVSASGGGFAAAPPTPNGTPLDAMVMNFMADVTGPAQILLSLFCYIAGFLLLMTAINRLTKRLDDGPRGPAGMGTIMTFFAAAAMFAMGDMMGAVVSSLFNSTATPTVANIGDDIMAAGAERDRVAAVIRAVIAFVAIVGMIGFIRGFFVLKAFADGQQNATVAQGLTFLFGGALAINFGALINTVQNSLGMDCGGGACITFG